MKTLLKSFTTMLFAVSLSLLFLTCASKEEEDTDMEWTFKNNCYAAESPSSGFYPIQYITVTPIGAYNNDSFDLKIGESKKVKYPINKFGFSYRITAAGLNAKTMEYDSYFTYGDMTIDASDYLKDVTRATLKGKTTSTKTTTTKSAKTTVTVSRTKANVVPDVTKKPLAITFNIYQ